jgi:hypothetical protein
MDLGLRGKSLQSVLIEHTVRMLSSLTKPMKHGAFRARTGRWSSAQQEASWPFGSHN